METLEGEGKKDDKVHSFLNFHSMSMFSLVHSLSLFLKLFSFWVFLMVGGKVFQDAADLILKDLLDVDFLQLVPIVFPGWSF